MFVDLKCSTLSQWLPETCEKFSFLILCIFIVLVIESSNISLNNFYIENKHKPCLTKQLLKL